MVSAVPCFVFPWTHICWLRLQFFSAKLCKKKHNCTYPESKYYLGIPAHRLQKLFAVFPVKAHFAARGAFALSGVEVVDIKLHF